MLSRRNIRVKVMQTLYAVDSLSGIEKPGEPLQILHKKIEQSKQLFCYLVYFTIEVARYAEIEANKRASKNLPSAEDLNVNTKLAGNELLWKILESTSFAVTLKEGKAEHLVDRELVKQIYRELIKTEEYKEYIEEQARDKKSERKILDFIFNILLLPNEDFITHIEERFINWDDDAENMQSMVVTYLSKNANQNLNDFLSKDKYDFAVSLLQTVINKKEHTVEIIKPKLKNWDIERIAALDMIMLHMGVCELLYFETIPTKVTINEYIDLAKAYSTPQSGQFVNGLLDNIHKDLESNNKLNKVNFKVKN
jgi:transcription antitermination protein NusB